jgi:hypothetical protein
MKVAYASNSDSCPSCSLRGAILYGNAQWTEFPFCSVCSYENNGDARWRVFADFGI